MFKICLNLLNYLYKKQLNINDKIIKISQSQPYLLKQLIQATGFNKCYINLKKNAETANLFLLKWSKKPSNALLLELQKLLIFFYSNGQKVFNCTIARITEFANLFFFYSNGQKSLQTHYY